jgi:glyoxylate carboligase
MILLGMHPTQNGVQLGGQVILQIASKQYAALSKFITVAQYHFTGRAKCRHRWLLTNQSGDYTQISQSCSTARRIPLFCAVSRRAKGGFVGAEPMGLLA